MRKPIYLVVTELFPTPESFRGPYVYDQVKAIEKDGRYDVIVVRPTIWVHSEGDYEYEGVKVYRFVTYDLPSDMWPGANIWLSLRAFDKCLKRIGIGYEDIAVVHAHVTGNARFANYVKSRNNKCLTVLQHHGYDVLGLKTGRFAEKEWHKTQALRYGVRECNKIDLHIGVSREIFKYLESYEGIGLKRKYVLYNGVDCEKFFPLHQVVSSSSSDINIYNKKTKRESPFTIGCVANFWELKDQLTLIKAVELLVKGGYENVRVKFVGTGYAREVCELYVKEHRLRDFFEFNSEVEHSQLNAFYNTLDLFVLPSYWDSFGCVYTEAYACGIPFMTAKGTGVTELIPEMDFDRWVIDPHDYIQLSKNIKSYIENGYEQKLLYPIEINKLVGEYLNYIGKVV